MAIAKPAPASLAALVGWALFDWAAQPFYALVVTFLFAPYFVNGFMADPVSGSSLWGTATGIAQLIAALLAPLCGAVADRGHRRKPWIAGFSILLIGGMSGLWLAVPHQTDRILPVLVSFGLALIGAELASVFINAMMPGLVSPKRLGRLSGIGWATGYVGGLISLVLMAGLIVSDPHSGKTLLGLTPLLHLNSALREGDRLVGPLCAVWFVLFAWPLFVFTPDNPTPNLPGETGRGLLALLRRLRALLAEHRQIALFLLARMLYADGLGAIFAFGGIYASTVFHWDATALGLFGIILIVTATFGAALGGFLDDRLGSKPVIGAMLVILIIGAIGVLSVDRTHVLYVIDVAPKLPDSAPFSSVGEKVYLAFALAVGIASGPVQAASRTLLAHLTPSDKITEFFGFFAFSGKATAFAAPLMIGAVTALSHSQRIGISMCLVFLIGGLILLRGVRTGRLTS
jgi:MFS transporter, UMF1 family